MFDVIIYEVVYPELVNDVAVVMRYRSERGCEQNLVKVFWVRSVLISHSPVWEPLCEQLQAHLFIPRIYLSKDHLFIIISKEIC